MFLVYFCLKSFIKSQYSTVYSICYSYLCLPKFRWNSRHFYFRISTYKKQINGTKYLNHIPVNTNSLLKLVDTYIRDILHWFHQIYVQGMQRTAKRTKAHNLWQTILSINFTTVVPYFRVHWTSTNYNPDSLLYRDAQSGAHRPKMAHQAYWFGPPSLFLVTRL